jgi:hypothetical protein
MSTLVPGHNRRWVERRAARIDCQIVRERDFRLVARATVDLSPDGMMVFAEEKVLTGEPVLVTFRPPRSERWVDAEGFVVRVGHGRRPGDPGRVLGVGFRWLSEGSRDLIRKSLVGLPLALTNVDRRTSSALARAS